MGRFTRECLKLHWKNTGRDDQTRIAAQLPPQGVWEARGLPYLANGHPLHTLNLYRPADRQGPLPVIVNVHGGGWMYGDADLNRHYCMTLAAMGWAVMGMSYRLLPEVELADQLSDVATAIRWLCTHGHGYGFDMDRVFLCGDSAGGHLAALTACIAQSPTLQRAFGVCPAPCPFLALGVLHGVCDVRSLGLMPPPVGGWVDREMHEMMFGPNPWASPLFVLARFRNAAAGLALPPVFLVGSKQDKLHPQTLAMARDLDRLGVAHRLYFRPEKGLDHVYEVCWPGWPQSVQTHRAMLDFFTRRDPGAAK